MLSRRPGRETKDMEFWLMMETEHLRQILASFEKVASMGDLQHAMYQNTAMLVGNMHIYNSIPHENETDRLFAALDVADSVANYGRILMEKIANPEKPLIMAGPFVKSKKDASSQCWQCCT